MVKEKILLIIVSILFIFAFALIMIEHAPYIDKSYSDTEISQNETRVAKAIAVEKEYHENGDYTSMTLQTEDKMLWVVNNTVCPLQSECEIEFDTKNTISVEDDEIIAVRCKIY